jgi:glycosyltransferase involved in cell wall biosynthesis
MLRVPGIGGREKGVEPPASFRHKAGVRISVIIPAFNEEKLIGRCLTAVAEAGAVFAGVGWSREVIVCDNNSTDHTAELARQAGATVVFEPVNQISRARNRGAQTATGDWLLFLDADSFPTRALFADLVAAIQSGRFIGGGANVEMENYRGRGNVGVVLWNWLSRRFHWAAGSFVFCETAAFRELGGFSEELFVSEEIDFSRRLKKLARRRGKKLTILSRTRLLTSARKLHLYSAREYRAFFRRCLLHPRRSQRDRAACGIWYDGRR